VGRDKGDARETAVLTVSTNRAADVSPSRVPGTPEEVPKRDKALVEAAARLGGDRGKNIFHPNTNQRDIEFTFSDTVKGIRVPDIVNTIGGMKVFMVQ